MRRLLPNFHEVMIFAALAVIGAAVVSMLNASSHDLVLSFLTVPLFIFAAVLGLRRNWARSAIAATVEPATTRAQEAAASTSAVEQ